MLSIFSFAVRVKVLWEWLEGASRFPMGHTCGFTHSASVYCRVSMSNMWGAPQRSSVPGLRCYKTQQYPPSHHAMPFNAELFHPAACLRLLQKKESELQAGGGSTEQNLFVDFLHVTHMILFFFF